MITPQEDSEAKRLIRAYRDECHKREYNGKNWPFHFKMDELRNSVWQGLRFLPNLKEITAEEFADHPAISGSYSAELLGACSCKHVEGMVYVRYAKVMMVGVQSNAGHGVAFVAVPKLNTREEWNKSQHYRVELKLRHWSFCICEHNFRDIIAYKNCNTTYRCRECDWTYSVDSSD